MKQLFEEEMAVKKSEIATESVMERQLAKAIEKLKSELVQGKEE